VACSSTASICSRWTQSMRWNCRDIGDRISTTDCRRLLRPRGVSGILAAIRAFSLPALLLLTGSARVVMRGRQLLNPRLLVL
jgi:hypothetical protein